MSKTEFPKIVFANPSFIAFSKGDLEGWEDHQTRPLSLPNPPALKWESRPETEYTSELCTGIVQSHVANAAGFKVTLSWFKGRMCNDNNSSFTEYHLYVGNKQAADDTIPTLTKAKEHARGVFRELWPQLLTGKF